MTDYTDPGFYVHLRVAIGVGLSLSLARLLTGLARFVQHPGRNPIYPVHLGWVAFMILEVLHFWWFEFALGQVHHWTFERFFFVMTFASIHFFIATVLFPDDLSDYGSFRRYFTSRKTWFFGLLIALIACDQIDTLLKGKAYYLSLGPAYPVKQGLSALVALGAIRIDREWYQIAAVSMVLAAEVAWIAWRHIS